MNATKTIKVVGVWYDKMSDPECPTWVVADEELFKDGSTAHTDTIRTFGQDRNAAIAFGTARAFNRHVPIMIQHS